MGVGLFEVLHGFVRDVVNTTKYDCGEVEVGGKPKSNYSKVILGISAEDASERRE